MRKLLVVGFAFGLGLMVSETANADPLSDWLLSLFGFGASHAQPQTVGDGTGL